MSTTVTSTHKIFTDIDLAKNDIFNVSKIIGDNISSAAILKNLEVTTADSTDGQSGNLILRAGAKDTTSNIGGQVRIYAGISEGDTDKKGVFASSTRGITVKPDSAIDILADSTTTGVISVTAGTKICVSSPETSVSITTANTNITTANTTIGTVNTTITTATAVITDLKVTATNSTVAGTTANTSIGTATTTIGTANTNITTANTTIGTANTYITTANTTISTNLHTDIGIGRVRNTTGDKKYYIPVGGIASTTTTIFRKENDGTYSQVSTVAPGAVLDGYYIEKIYPSNTSVLQAAVTGSGTVSDPFIGKIKGANGLKISTVTDWKDTTNNDPYESYIETHNLKVNNILQARGFMMYWDEEENSLVFAKGSILEDEINN